MNRTEPEPVTAIYRPGTRVWTSTAEGTLNVWEVDDDGVPRLAIADPPFPAPEGEPFVFSQTTRMIQLLAKIFAVLAFAVGIVGLIGGDADMRSYVAWAAPVVFVLVVLVGYCRHRDKRRAFDRS